MIDISIIILNYKTKDLVLNCLESIRFADFGNLKYEIILVDNNSRDGIGEAVRQEFPQVILVENEKNLGMGEGNNIGIKAAHGRHLAIMNPDTVASKDTFVKLYEFMQANQRVGVVGPQQLNNDNTIQDSCFRWHKFLTPIFRRTFLGKFSFAKKDLDRFLMVDFDHKSTKKVDWLLGSFLFCRREALNEIGLFDKRFFLYFEDTDLCRRFWEHGWEVIYFPETKIIHDHQRQSARNPWYIFFGNKAAWCHIVSWIKFLWKWRFTQLNYTE
jgi:GT2 family glycosyltransferase